MSNKVSVLVYSRKVGSPVRKAVLVYFAERASDGGEGIWAAKSTIAEAIECGRSTVIRTINDFVREGILIPVGTRPHANGDTIEYDMDLAVITALPKVREERQQPRVRRAAPVPERYPSQSETRPAAGPHPSQSGTPPVPQRDPNHHRTTIEPLEPNGSLSSGDDAAANRASEIQSAFDAYNAAAVQSGWVQALVLDKPRRAALSARLRDCGGLEGWAVALAKAQASSFCCGVGRDRPIANFGFLTKKSTFIKLMEGNYDDKPCSQTSGRTAAAGGLPGVGDRRGPGIASIVARRAFERGDGLPRG